MEWFHDLIDYNSTVIRESIDIVVERVSDTGTGVYNKLLDLALLPFAAFLIGLIETSLKYLLEEGEYQKYEEATTQGYYSALTWLQLTQFQSKLIWEFFIIIIGNSFLVFVAWWWYGERIRNHFMQSGSATRLKNLEEIKEGYSHLKLPKEMDFKFK